MHTNSVGLHFHFFGRKAFRFKKKPSDLRHSFTTNAHLENVPKVGIIFKTNAVFVDIFIASFKEGWGVPLLGVFAVPPLENIIEVLHMQGN